MRKESPREKKLSMSSGQIFISVGSLSLSDNFCSFLFALSIYALSICQLMKLLLMKKGIVVQATIIKVTVIE